MPNGQRESYEAVPRRPKQQGTEGPALSMSPVFSVPLLPCLKQTLSCLSPLLLPELVHLLPCLKHTLPLSQTYPVLSQPSVTPRTCSSVTLSPITSNLFTRLLVHLSTCHVTLSFSYPTPVSNIPCLPILLTLSPYPPYPVPTLSQKK